MSKPMMTKEECLDEIAIIERRLKVFKKQVENQRGPRGATFYFHNATPVQAAVNKILEKN